MTDRQVRVGPEPQVDRSGLRSDDYLKALAVVAESAWRVREMINLNLDRIVASGDTVLIRNVVDALNDLNAALPLSEDGRSWGPLLPGGDPR